MVYYDYIRMVEYKKKRLGIIQMSSKLGIRLCNIRKRVPRTIHPLNVLFFKQRVDRLVGTHLSLNRTRNTSNGQTHLLDVGNLGSKPL